MSIRRSVLSTAFAAALASFAAAVTAQTDPSLKVGFVYVGPVGDAGWTYAHDQGRKALVEALGDRVETTYVESVPEGADAERVIRQLAADDHRLIFTTSFGYMNQTLKVARAFPDVYFAHATGYKTAENMSTYEARTYQGAYLNGILAGHMTDSDILGFVASYPIPEVIRNINAFTLGARKVNPDITTKVIWVNSWYDPAKERQAAEALIAQGADVLHQNTDSLAIVKAAQENEVYAFGWDSNMSEFGPDAHLTAAMIDWSGYYIQSTEQVLSGKWQSHRVYWGLEEGMIVMAPLNDLVPAAARADFERERRAIIDGHPRSPFTGPIRDQDGNLKVPEGEIMPRDMMMGIDWYVEGVEGSIPN